MSDDTPATQTNEEPAELQTENAGLRDRLLRALADAENTRRRADQASAEARRYAVADFARELLAVADNLQRALAAAGDARRGEGSLIEGVEATLRLLTATLERFGVQRIDALGQRFDPSLHEAVSMQESADLPPGTITGVIEDGYTINGRLLRPARVVVAKSASPSIAPELHGESQVNERQA